MTSRPQEQAPSDYDQAVYNLAALAGIAVNWIDAYDQPQTVSPASLRTILATLGLPCDSHRQADESRARLQEINRSAALPSLITAEVGKDIVLPAQCGLQGQSCLIILESGEQLARKISGNAGNDGDAPIIAAIDRYGYHRLQVAGIEVTLAVAPPRCYGVADAFLDKGDARERGWGLALQLYGLRSEDDGGIGSFGGLAQLATKAGKEGATALAISPVHAMFAADTHRFSPYSPSSRLFLNVLHIDPADVMGRSAMQQVLQEAGPEAMALQQRLEHASQVNWPEAGRHRLNLLRRLYGMFRMQGTPSAEFAAFRLQGGRALADHALFEALHHTLSAKTPGIASDWRHWPERYHHPESAELRRFAQEQGGEIDFHVFLQWQAARSLQRAQQAARDSGMAVGLIADLAVGADNGGSQAWSHSDEMIAGLSVGAPPDLLNTRGQNWGIGAFSPLAMRAAGFRSYIAMLRSVFAHAGGVRIDHVMGLTRLWLTPEGADANDGAYLRYPASDLLRLVALESWRHRAIVIGEDLGTVPEGFDTQLQNSGLLGIGVLWFEREQKQFLPPKAWPAHAIATTSTHDLPTVAGWWSGRDIGWRAELDLLTPGDTEAQALDDRKQDRRSLWQALQEAGCVSGEQPADDQPESVADGAAAYIAQTPAPLALLPIEDLLGLEEQPNLPGTVAVHPNWQRRLPATASTLLEQTPCRRRMRLLQRPDIKK
ncbi:4-alpha-glucanotransferase [Herbaspirillum sp. meg3]|uniref:4-alpha-glucanotransferase n=1 Tax=Herbaspirillum sp. meg3 TaxID=2025949 RepID=UPI000B99B9AD|nr:4-alpha-glucanotransferase [Herbaspirillum sp. meg3]ASU38823.1 4-alpha-glucanotransferase [Herbaspirillum sp. meg3]